jgi:hypothetical protein
MSYELGCGGRGCVVERRMSPPADGGRQCPTPLRLLKRLAKAGMSNGTVFTINDQRITVLALNEIEIFSVRFLCVEH